MPLFTVFTTACNRPNELQRLYGSLLKQTYKNFVWLIVDDSIDGQVSTVVDSFIREKCITIDYHKQNHRGKYWAQKMGFALVRTPYMVDIDDDDELTEDSLEVLAKEWKRIEEEGKDEIGVLCGLCVDKNGNVLSYHDKRRFIDTDYIEMEWTHNHPSDNLISRKLEVVKNVDIFNVEEEWLANEVALVRESVLWNRVARYYKSRYINHPLMICHTDTAIRLSNKIFDRQKCIDYVFSNYILLNELEDRLWENPKDSVKYLAEYMACGSALKYGIKTLELHIDVYSLKVIALLLYPFALLLGIYFRKKYFVSEVDQ